MLTLVSSTLSACWRVLRMLPGAGRALSAAALAGALLQPLLGLGFMLALGNLVARIPEAVRGGDSGVWGSLGLLAAVHLVQQLLGAAHSLAVSALGRRFNSGLEDRVMAALFDPSGIEHLEDPGIRDLASEASDGLHGRWSPGEVPGAFAALLGGALSLAAAVGVVIWSNWWLGLLLGAAAVWAVAEIYAQFLRMFLGMLDDSGTSEMRRSDYEYDFAISAESAKEARMFGFAAWAMDRAVVRKLGAFGLMMRNLGRIRPREVVAVLLLILVIAGGFVWTAWQAGHGALGIAAATVFAQALLAPISHHENLTQALLDLRMNLRPVRALLDLESRLPARRPAAGGTPPAPAASGTVRFEDVWFRYPGSETEVLRGVDLEFPVGGSLALVGLNGAGKTTLVKLLCRFYEPTSGRITLDGTDISELPAEVWQRQVAAIFQDFARFPMSARDNLRVGRLDADDEALRSAAEKAGIDQVLSELPDGWNTPLSKELTGGTDLSGGQWQRLALARALVAAGSGAGVLVMDEPAANLDIRAEAELNHRFLDLTDGRTTLVISHRFSTVRLADRICVLDGGRVTEVGSHEELVAAGGSYADLFTLQASRFAR